MLPSRKQSGHSALAKSVLATLSKCRRASSFLRPLTPAKDLDTVLWVSLWDWEHCVAQAWAELRSRGQKGHEGIVDILEQWTVDPGGPNKPGPATGP